MIAPSLHKIAEQEGLQIRKIQPLHGGDINQVFYCDTSMGELVIKFNDAQSLPELFTKEANGLNELWKSRSFIIPEIIANGQTDDCSYLILSFLSPQRVTNWAPCGEQLAKLHQNTEAQFGFYEWNYIGRLVQYNEPEATAAEFFIHQRLAPQFQLAAENNFHFQEKEKLYQAAEQLIPEEPPALIHGDLWSGNYLHTTQGFALIDPAVCYGIREMDLAMMQLFGGFPGQVFEAYQDHFPTQPNLEERIPLYQLYYILVHVNLFGSAYYARAKQLMQKYCF